MTKKVLIVDDSIYMRAMIGDALKGAGYEIIGEAANGEAAIEMCQSLNPDLVTLDNILPDLVGMDILKILKDKGVSSKILMISAVGQKTMIDKGKALGAEGYIVKPFEQSALVEQVNKLFAA